MRRITEEARVEPELAHDGGGIISGGILLQCPRCGMGIVRESCPECAYSLRNVDGVVAALPPRRAAYYEYFIKDYERIRAAEGRGSQDETFYLGLPYRDTTRKNSKQWQVRARSFDYLLNQILRVNVPMPGGRILDLGAGNCWMSYRLATSGYRPVAVDLLTNNRDGLGAAEHYRSHLPELFPRFQAELSHLPFHNDQFDAVVFNASLHYAEDYEAVLLEALRCVKAGGMVIISDTPWYSREESGQQMVSERRAAFLAHYGTASDSIRSLEYLTDKRLRTLEEQLGVRWTTFSPSYGLRWAMRPLIAKLRRRREPARFHIYVAKKTAA
jgi:ubiquinone/menaquinone biosynthesis C-methylase UbiE